MIVGVPACTSPSGPASDNQDTSVERSDLSASPNAFKCDIPPGLPIPIPKEPAWDSCMESCLANAPVPPGQCVGTCCLQVVHCAECFVQ
jgi:hypothetical protein